MKSKTYNHQGGSVSYIHRPFRTNCPDPVCSAACTACWQARFPVFFCSPQSKNSRPHGICIPLHHQQQQQHRHDEHQSTLRNEIIMASFKLSQGIHSLPCQCTRQQSFVKLNAKPQWRIPWHIFRKVGGVHTNTKPTHSAQRLSQTLHSWRRSDLVEDFGPPSKP